MVLVSDSEVFIKLGGMFENIEKKVISNNEELKVILVDNYYEKTHLESSAKEICVSKGGKYIEDKNECEGIDESACEELNGEFESCASACRHEEADMCIQSCVSVCSFEEENLILESSHDYEHEEKHHEEEEFEFDPHVWISITKMIEITKKVELELSSLYPQHSKEFKNNSLNYVNKLEKLKLKYDEELVNCNKDKIIVNHESFGYLGMEYNFEQISIAGFEPESEPTIQTISKILEVAKKENLKFVFTEGHIENNIAKTIANEINGEILVLKLIKSKDNETYFTIMEENLNALVRGLECK